MIFAARAKERYGIFDGDKWIVPPMYQFIGFFHAGFAYARNMDGTECLIDTFGKPYPLTEVARQVGPFSSLEFISPNESIDSPGCLIVSSSENWTIWTLDRRLVPNLACTIPRDFDLAPFYGGSRLFVRISTSLDHQMVLITGEEERTLDGFEYIDPSIDDGNLLAAKRCGDPSTWFYYNRIEGRLVSEPFFLAQSFSERLGLIQREIDSPFEFIDTTFDVVDGLTFERADIFRYGLAAATKDGIQGYYNNQGECLIACKGDLGRFNRFGQAIIDSEDPVKKVFLMDRNGMVKIESLSTCTFFDSDFPCYHGVINQEDVLITPEQKIFPLEID